MILVEIYSKKDCSLCKKAKQLIDKINAEMPFSFKEIDIAASEDLLRKYKEDIPTIFINGKKAFKFKVDETEFRKKLRRELIKNSLSRMWNKKEHFT
ncbi:MAG: glutaredoxin family protein [Deltaproteobacteria bacterium]|nr:glutaredoxin family protein [Deltaproteobacteria bacterium]